MFLLVAWVLLTIPVFVLGGAAVSNRIDGQHMPATNASVTMTAILVLPSWWSIYFVIVYAASLNGCR